MPFISIRLLDAMAYEKAEEHQPTDDLEAHAWVLLWEFAWACVQHGIDVAGCQRQLESLQYRDAGALADGKYAMMSRFQLLSRIGTLPNALKAIAPVLGPWFKIVELAEKAMWQQKKMQGRGGSPEDAQARMQKIFEAAYQRCILAIDQSVLNQLPETWAELSKAPAHATLPDYDALLARVAKMKLET
jgi:hypothetical protein